MAVVSNNISIRNARTVRRSMLCYVQLCRVMATGVSTEAHVPYHVSPCGICDDRMALEQEFVWALQPSPVTVIQSMLYSHWFTCTVKYLLNRTWTEGEHVFSENLWYEELVWETL